MIKLHLYYFKLDVGFPNHLHTADISGIDPQQTCQCMWRIPISVSKIIGEKKASDNFSSSLIFHFHDLSSSEGSSAFYSYNLPVNIIFIIPSYMVL